MGLDSFSYHVRYYQTSARVGEFMSPNTWTGLQSFMDLFSYMPADLSTFMGSALVFLLLVALYRMIAP